MMYNKERGMKQSWIIYYVVLY